ncbi:hypothetical protein FQN55_001952 [Onygenales sp. PD_40]|nr:hypothetical protein FQN55_001952 [Onygenales sp. PD_40]
MSPPPSHAVYLLPLSNDGSPAVPRGYISLPPPTHPPLGSSSLETDFGNLTDGGLASYGLIPEFNTAIEIDVPIVCAGAFAFYLTYAPLPEFAAGGNPNPTREFETCRSPTHYVNVSPAVSLRGQQLPLNALSIFSVISKFMGPSMGEWDAHLRGIGRRGYNMVHFTPLMARGSSDSPYSIFDQLRFDPACFPNGEEDVAGMISRMETEYGLLGLTDVVWNHTANNSGWLEEHPEAGYSVDTAPWLEAAVELDTALLEYSEELGGLGLPVEFGSVEDLLAVMKGMRSHVVDKIRLWEFYAVDVKRDAKATIDAYVAGNITIPKGGFGEHTIGALEEIRGWSLKEKAQFIRDRGLLNKDRILGRYGRVVDPGVGAALITALYGRYNEASDIAHIREDLAKILDELNLPLFLEFDKDVLEIFDQVFNRVKYLRLDDHGPKLGPITKESPLIETYFTRLPLNETTRKHSPESLALVNNGWVWNADAMRDNAGPDSRAYLRREVIIWGDCVKLRYGNGPEDSPFLWDYMARYTRLMAKYFAGFRIDNCHSTPLAVAEYLLDEARRVRPNLSVFAELFTGAEETDYVFTKRLGLNALIREAMQAWNTAELSRLVHRHGGRPIGSFDIDLPTDDSQGGQNKIIKHIPETPVQALFMDCTHDNEAPAQKREARDTLPNAALVSMCASASGSVMGYDEIYPKHLDLVNETRLYTSAFSEGEVPSETGKGGIGGAKKLLNKLHTMMAVDGYDETHIHHEGEYITVHRVQPNTRKGIFLVAHAAFPGFGNGNGGLDPIYLTGTKAKLLGAWRLEVDDSEKAKDLVLADKEYLRGLPSEVMSLSGVQISEKEHDTIVSIPEQFPPGSIALLETWIPGAELSENLRGFITSGADEAFAQLDLIDLNFVLYRCDAEEKDSSDAKDGVYNVPNLGPLVYAGLQGWWSVLETIVKSNNLAHPLCDHIRNGQWAFDFIVGRMNNAVKFYGYEHLEASTKWLKDRFDAIRQVPNFLVPRYFAMIVQTAYYAAYRRGMRLFGDNVRQGTHFIHQLAMVSVQQTGYVKSASLYPTKQVPSLAAGLPHFSTDWARCWGRDVFISLRGLLLCTGRFAIAKEHILAFASVLKHGMIPNLLGSGKLPRYNSRDSVWFFLQAIQDYTVMVPDGIQILDAKVPRRFLPYEDTWFPFDDERAYSQTSTVAEIIQEVFQRHATGLSFREYNAGPELDMQMKPEGFQIDVRVDWETGLIFGGNQWNCGTWMDKMGESVKAGNKGYPGTPRDGAAIEISGLLYSALRWVEKLHNQGLFKHSGVQTGSDKTVSFAEWATKVQSNFEKCYYIPLYAADDINYDVNTQIINRRGIYKDLYKSTQPYEDYQLRPNFTIAMTVAPDLFTPSNALHALAVADKVLRGPTGMATLDPGDLNYRPYYNNAEDSGDFNTAKGRNYHQGPEWVWPTGFFLRALLKFTLMREGTDGGREEAFQQVARRLEGCKKAIGESDWRGLTELTNKGGERPDLTTRDSLPVTRFQPAKTAKRPHRIASHRMIPPFVPPEDSMFSSLLSATATATTTSLLALATGGNNTGGGGDGDNGGGGGGGGGGEDGHKYQDQTRGQRDLYTQIVISSAVGFVAFMGFCILRPKWRDLYAARRRLRSAASRLPELPDTLFGWIPIVHRISEDEVLASAGLDAYVFLSFYKYAIRFLLTVFCFTIVIILPVHYFVAGKMGYPWDTPDDNDDPGQTKPDPNYLWMHVIFAYVFTGIGLSYLIDQTNKIIEIRQQYLGGQTTMTDRTIRLSGIPPELRSEEKIKDFIEELEIGKVDKVMLCQDWSQLDGMMDARKQILQKLEEAWTKHVGYRWKRPDSRRGTLPLVRTDPMSASLDLSGDDERSRLLSSEDSARAHVTEQAGERPRIRVWYGPLKLQYKSIDAIDFYEEKLRQLDEKIEEIRNKECPPTPLAFVTMETIAACQMAVQAILDPWPMQLEASLAPAPADVVWRNTYLSRWNRMLRGWSITLVIGGLTIFWSIVLIPLAYLLNLEALEKVIPSLAETLSWHPLAKSLVQTGLPTLILSLLTVAVPFIYNWLANLQGMTSQGDVELSVISKNFFFTFFNLFLVFTVFATASNFVGLWKNVRDAFRDTTTVALALAQSLETLAPFYTNLIILQGLGLFPFRLLEFGSVFTYPFKRLSAKTPRDYADLGKPPTFSYGLALPQTILIFIICVVYSVFPSSWLVCLFGLLYFTIGRFIYKYQLLYAMDHQQHSTGRAWPMICSRIIIGLLVFQLAIIGTLALRTAITRSILIVPLLAFTVWFSYFFSRTYDPLMKFIALRSIDRTNTRGDEQDESPTPISTMSPPSQWDRDAIPLRFRGRDFGPKLRKYINPNLVIPLDEAWIPGRGVGLADTAPMGDEGSMHSSIHFDNGHNNNGRRGNGNGNGSGNGERRNRAQLSV